MTISLKQKTKIICTLGPATDNLSAITALVKAGMDVVRLNFSHGIPTRHIQTINTIRTLEGPLGKKIAILQDVQGPRIRLGELKNGSLLLEEGSSIVITSRPVLGDSNTIPTSYQYLSQDIKPCAKILLHDGTIVLQVDTINGEDVRCQVVRGGVIRSHQGMNLPGTDIRLPTITDKDRKDIALGIKHGVDYIALSFVRRVDDLLIVKKILQAEKQDIPLIAKLERAEAITHLEEILTVADAVMIARGDLGVELSLERVPILQKEIIFAANKVGVPVITATQMLESMVTQPTATRAEASDVANAIFDGTDAVMLSAETAIGKYPIEAVKTMSRIINAAEERMLARGNYPERHGITVSSFPGAICESAARAARAIKAKAIVAFTQSGYTAKIISKNKPSVPIIAYTPDARVMARMSLYWGVIPRLMRTISATDELLAEVEKSLLTEGFASHGDNIVIVMGLPIAARGITNLLKLHQIGSNPRSN